MGVVLSVVLLDRRFVTPREDCLHRGLVLAGLRLDAEYFLAVVLDRFQEFNPIGLLKGLLLG